MRLLLAQVCEGTEQPWGSVQKTSSVKPGVDESGGSSRQVGPPGAGHLGPQAALDLGQDRVPTDGGVAAAGGEQRRLGARRVEPPVPGFGARVVAGRLDAQELGRPLVDEAGRGPGPPNDVLVAVDDLVGESEIGQ
jgi:hypothetical protein